MVLRAFQPAFRMETRALEDQFEVKERRVFLEMIFLNVVFLKVVFLKVVFLKVVFLKVVFLKVVFLGGESLESELPAVVDLLFPIREVGFCLKVLASPREDHVCTPSRCVCPVLNLPARRPNP